VKFLIPVTPNKNLRVNSYMQRSSGRSWVLCILQSDDVALGPRHKSHVAAKVEYPAAAPVDTTLPVPRAAITEAMAAQSKLLSTDHSLRAFLSRISSTYLKHRTRISRAVYLTLFLALINRIRHAIDEQKRSATARQREQARSITATAAGGKERRKVELNREFFRNLFRLLKIVVPGFKSREMRLLVSHSVFLVIRTLISLHVAELDGKLVSALVRGKGRDFLWGVVWWMLVAVPATFTNSMVGSPFAFFSSFFRIVRLTSRDSCRIINANWRCSIAPG
jgi:hypothetical protein